MDVATQKQSLRAEHTPGPWQVIEIDAHTLGIVAPWSTEVRPTNASGYGDHRGIHICEVEHQNENPCVSKEQALANFLFIATAPTLLAALENIECPDCGHLLKCHADKYGCEFERGDKWIDSGNGDRLVAQGPCSCTCEDLPDLQAAIEAIRLAKGGAQ